MKMMRINELKTINGKNNLYYQIEFYDISKSAEISLNESTCNKVVYPRRIARLLHETSIFKDISKLENKPIKDNLCNEYKDKLIKTINKLIEINTVR